MCQNMIKTISNKSTASAILSEEEKKAFSAVGGWYKTGCRFPPP